jgi:cell wall-associated NlpC family hydrolase
VRRGAALAVALAAATGLAVYSGAAGAAPQPSISDVQAQVNSLQARVDKLGEQYDQAGQQLSAAKARLAMVNKQATAAEAQYTRARNELAAVAVDAYENANSTSVLGLLTSGDPAAVLSQASLLMQLAGTHNMQTTQFLSAAEHLAGLRQQQQRTEMGIAQLHSQVVAKLASITKLLDSRKALLASLTAAQQATVTATTTGGGGTSTPVTYTGPTTTQADKAVAFAYAQIGKPYVWGATGPDSYDCSGLVQRAWAQAGVSIPRTTYDQWAALPHISMSALQPGDLIYYNGEGHVAMFVGKGMIIDAPRTGLNVELIPMNTSWYLQSEDGATRP